MTSAGKKLIELETRFWQSMVSQDTDVALDLLDEPALMVSTHGAMKFDHDGYRKMAEQGSMVLTDFELSDMEVVFPNDTTAILTYHVRQSMTPRGKRDVMTEEMHDSSTWIEKGGRWQCVMHTETPVKPAPAKH